MRVVVLGATGRTGRRLLEGALARGHEPVALLREPLQTPTTSSATLAIRGDVEVHLGDAREPTLLREALTGGDAVLSALDATSSTTATTFYRDVATALVAAMRARRVHRYIGVSAAGVRVAGDHGALRARIASLMRHGAGQHADRQREYRVWAESGLDWTLVRPARLIDPVSGHGRCLRVEHHPHQPPPPSSISRALLAQFLLDELECPRYVAAAPLVAGR